ncbi:hypothetical protein V497_03605 [Pseudogymnoascus sp. VKM F-4516 (FW-969)]|nr:hypothetical protein V497_03605 [Pseudogymnoascus sp. VKM F-4516 (FW-969)]
MSSLSMKREKREKKKVGQHARTTDDRPPSGTSQSQSNGQARPTQHAVRSTQPDNRALLPSSAINWGWALGGNGQAQNRMRIVRAGEGIAPGESGWDSGDWR